MALLGLRGRPVWRYAPGRHDWLLFQGSAGRFSHGNAGLPRDNTMGMRYTPTERIGTFVESYDEEDYDGADEPIEVCTNCGAYHSEPHNRCKRCQEI